MEYTIPPKRLETCWGPVGHGKGAIRYRFRVDGSREHHGVYSKEPYQ